MKFRFEKPEVSVQKSQSFGSKSEISVQNPEFSVRIPEVSVRKPEVWVQNPEVSGKFFEFETSVKVVFRNASVASKFWRNNHF
jgi:hypothetical protein